MTDAEKNTKDTTADAEKVSNVKVQTNPKKVHKNAAYFDPEQKKTIGSKAVTVKETPFVSRLLLSEVLVKAK